MAHSAPSAAACTAAAIVDGIATRRRDSLAELQARSAVQAGGGPHDEAAACQRFQIEGSAAGREVCDRDKVRVQR